jgi:hypothetical protein
MQTSTGRRETGAAARRRNPWIALTGLHKHPLDQGVAFVLGLVVGSELHGATNADEIALRA